MDIMLSLDVEQLVREYQSGKSLGAISKQFRAAKMTILSHLQRAGVPIRAERAHNRIDVPEAVVEEYKNGEAIYGLSLKYGISRGAITRRLIELNIDRRGYEGAQAERYKRTDKTELQRMTKAAQDACRGSKRSDSQLAFRAQEIERRFNNGSHQNVSDLELFVADLLRKRDIQFAQQKAIGKYNVDFLIGGNAILEIFGGLWHFTGSHAKRMPDRIKYLRERGYRFLAIYTEKDITITEQTIGLIQDFIDSDIECLIIRADGRVREFAK